MSKIQARQEPQWGPGKTFTWGIVTGEKAVPSPETVLNFASEN